MFAVHGFWKSIHTNNMYVSCVAIAIQCVCVCVFVLCVYIIHTHIMCGYKYLWSEGFEADVE